MKYRSSFILVALLVLICSVASAQDWRQWRGPERTGVVPGYKAPAIWPDKLRLAWRVPVGGGFSSPLVSGNRIYLHARDEEKEQEVVSCLDLATGKTIWQQSYPVAFSKNQYAVKMGKGPHSTPVLHDGSLYTLGVTAILSSFDAATGALKWRKDYAQQIDTSKMFCGTSVSPVIEGGAVIVHIGDDRGGRVAAFDAQTGKERWEWKGDGPGYASPLPVTLDGVRQIVTLTDKSVIGIAVADGRLLWRVPYADEWNENIVTPVVYNGTLIVSGVRRGTMALRVKRSGAEWTTGKIWETKDVAMYMSSPVLDGHLLYGMSHLRKGQFFCLDARTGQVLWTTEGREGDNAALLGAGNLLFVLTNDGALVVARKSEKGFESVKKYQVGESATWAHPVLIQDRIIVRDANTVTVWML